MRSRLAAAGSGSPRDGDGDDGSGGGAAPYLPGSGSRSAGRGAAGALPPSFLLPSPPPRGATHNTHRKRKRPAAAARRLVEDGRSERPRPRRAGPSRAAGGGPGPEVRACAVRNGPEREPAASRWLRRPGDPGSPRETDGRACASRDSEAHGSQRSAALLGPARGELRVLSPGRVGTAEAWAIEGLWASGLTFPVSG